MAEDSTVTNSRDHAPPSREVAPQLVVITVCDEPSFVSSRHSLAAIDEVRFGRGPRAATRRTDAGLRVLELRLPDPRVSSEHGRLRRGPSGWLLEDPTSKNGAVVSGEITRRAIVADDTLFELGHTFFWFGGDLADEPPDQRADELTPSRPTLATFDRALAGQFDELARVAPTTVSVLLFGETGTGKEVIARALHDLSGRSGAFVAVNCGALPETLVEAQVFGHKKGAFSGATADRPGLVRAADRGTLFLDEVAELPAASQTAFLRVLQEREVVPIGEDRPIKVDVRVCCATHQDLESMVASGTFRADLYARLGGLDVELPPLRSRRGDLGILIATLLARIPGGERIRFSPPAMRMVVRYRWPLNVRELEKVLQRAVALATDGTIEVEHLPEAIQGSQRTPLPVPAAPAPALDDEDRALRARLVELLTVHGGNVRAAAEAIGKRRTQVYRWLERFGIDLDAFRP